MSWRIAPRKAAAAAVITGSQQALDRQTDRIPSRQKSEAYYGYVRFDWSTFRYESFPPITEASECELCNIDGSRIAAPYIGFIDSTQGFLPPTFGDYIWFELQPIGNRYISGIGQRMLFRIVRQAGTTGIGVPTPSQFQVLPQLGSLLQPAGMVQDGSGSPIITTINGVAGHNNIIISGTQGFPFNPAGILFDLPQPLQWGLLASAGIPTVYPIWYNFRRVGPRQTIFIISIDNGECFDVDWCAIGNDVGGPPNQMTSFGGTLKFYWNEGLLYMLPVVSGIILGNTPPGTAGIAYGNPGSYPFAIAVPTNVSITVLTVTFGLTGTVQVTATIDATSGRVTDIAMDGTGNIGNPIMVISGGRGSD